MSHDDDVMSLLQRRKSFSTVPEDTRHLSFLIAHSKRPGDWSLRYFGAVIARFSMPGDPAHLTGNADIPPGREVFANRIKTIAGGRAQLRRPDNCTVVAFMPKYHRWNCRSLGGIQRPVVRISRGF